MWVIAHRGASGSAPENTLAAFRRAADIGARFIETDLQLSRDAHLIALHDDTLDRTTNGRGPASAYTFDQLREFDAGSWFHKGKAVRDKGDGFAAERIPGIQDVLAFGRERDVGLYLELKTPGASGAEHALAGALRASGEIERTVVIAFDIGVLTRVRRFDPLIVLGYLYSQPIANVAELGVSVGLRQILPRIDLVTPDLVAEAHRKDLSVVTWTVNSRQQMKKSISAGVDGIITDYPERLIAVLAGD